MIPWKIKWTTRQILSWKVCRSNWKTLKNPFVYYKALGIMLLKGESDKPIRFNLRNGGCFSIDDFIGCYLYWEIFLYNCYDMKPRKDSHITIVDVGAHTGLSALRYRHMYPDSEIHCYEPFPGHLDNLRQNLTLCSPSNIFFYQKGVSAQNKTTTLYIHGSNSGGHSIFPVDTPSGTQEVELVDLHEVLKNTSKGEIDILKLDCEEAEVEIIQSIDASLAPKIKEIIYEATPDKYDPKFLMDHLTSIGYETTDLDGTVFRAVYKG